MQKSRHYKKNIPRFSLGEVYVARTYESDMQQKLHRFKFVHNHVDTEYFRTLFRALIEESGIKNLSEYSVVYPPISLKDRIFRGPNHAKKLAILFASIIGSKNVFCPFTKSFFAGHQSRRKKGERKKVQSEYVFKKNQRAPLKNTEVILIDDIITTGYTAHTLGRLLQRSGTKKTIGFFLSSKKVERN